MTSACGMAEAHLPGGVQLAEEVAQAGKEDGGLLDVRERLPVEAP